MPELKPSSKVGWCQEADAGASGLSKAVGRFNPWLMVEGLPIGRPAGVARTAFRMVLGEAPARAGGFAAQATNIAHNFPMRAKSRGSRAAGQPDQLSFAPAPKKFRGPAPFGLASAPTGGRGKARARGR